MFMCIPLLISCVITNVIETFFPHFMLHKENKHHIEHYNIWRVGIFYNIA